MGLETELNQIQNNCEPLDPYTSKIIPGDLMFLPHFQNVAPEDNKEHDHFGLSCFRA